MSSAQYRAVLVDENDKDAHELSGVLTRIGFDVTRAAQDAEQVVRDVRPHLIALEPDSWHSQTVDGFEIARKLRESSNAFLVLVSRHASDADQVVGFRLGADEFLGKPLQSRLATLRLRALMRRSPTQATTTLVRFDDLVIDFEGRRVTLGESTVDLTKKEFDILQTLASHPGQVVSRTRILDMAWRDSYAEDSHTVDVHVANLRRKLGEEGRRTRHIVTVRGVGFRFEP